MSEDIGESETFAEQPDPRESTQLFRLRDAFVTDRSAAVRRAALLRLDAEAATRLVCYVRDACDDPSPLVREGAYMALARARDPESLERALFTCQRDRSFRVRRMALVYATRTHGLGARALLSVAAKDPFWRVRMAASRTGLALGFSLDIAPEAPALPGAALGWLYDDDPAVITARLAQMPGQVVPQVWVGLLGHSHQPLRQLAVKALRACRELGPLRDALSWLDDERVPYGPAAAEAALAQNERTSSELARAVLAEDFEANPGALAWAIAASRTAPPWERVRSWLEHDDSRVRCAATQRVPEAAPGFPELLATMAGLLGAPDAKARCFAASWLTRSGTRAARQQLAELVPDQQPTRVRGLIADAATTLGDLAVLERLAQDPHGAVRAAALRGIVHLEGPRPELESQDDPWVREALVTRATAAVAACDPALNVRRAGVRLLSAPQDSAWADRVTAEREPDPWLRAHAATLLAAQGSEPATRCLLRLARDIDLGVRSAAQASLESHAARAHILLTRGVLPPAERIAAHTLLGATALGERAAEDDPRVIEHIALLEALSAGRAPVTSPAAAPSPLVGVGAGPRRTLGNTGLLVNPFGLSGAHGLGAYELSLAQERGVNLFFWEPGYLELARFLRRVVSNVVVTGTYHADAAAIERDVARARRSLRREVIDVFLAFWTRSTARLELVTETLRALVESGQVRAVGISTHDRALALAAARLGLDLVMVRHSAAHRGAEAAVFPECAARGTAVLTFSNLCYGRMLHQSPAPLSAPVTAPDCYRYSLSQPGVSACIAAPRRRSELLENLTVTSAPALDTDRIAELRAHGDHVYARSKAWSAEAWQEPRPPISRVAAAPEHLEDWLEYAASVGTDS